QTELPDLECEMSEHRVPVRYPSEVACTSAVHHTIGPGNTVTFTTGVVNTAAFQSSSNFLYASYSIVYGPNPNQATAAGDSGMGCLDFATDRLAVIHNSGGPTLLGSLTKNPLSSDSVGQLVAFYCDWINE